MDAAILGPILGVLTLAFLWLRQDVRALGEEIRQELADLRTGREADRALANSRHEAIMAVLRDHGERLARLEGRAEGRAEAREEALSRPD